MSWAPGPTQEVRDVDVRVYAVQAHWYSTNEQSDIEWKALRRMSCDAILKYTSMKHTKTMTTTP